ncbi:MAG: DNA polymerase Y family protein [Alphaproteobacteria bacterium]|nr:DNA polymerase Y family protein [Alphaproteobacteria bacterium]
MTTPSPIHTETAETRWLALWLPRLSTDRLKRIGSAPADRPLAVYAKTGNAFALTAVDARATAFALAVGMPLSDARALCPALYAVEAEPDADAQFLDGVAAWCERYTPVVVLDPPDGVFLDITGCAHLFGGELALRAVLLNSLVQQSLNARTAIAPTPAAAWAFARFGKQRVVDSAGLNAALASLPIAALRVSPEAQALLRRFGLKQIGQIADAPRGPFAARAGQHVLLRLDQACARARQALTPRRPTPPLLAFRRLVEPIITLDAILVVAEALCADIVAQCDRNGVGVRRLRLSLFGVDAKTRRVSLGLSRPERDARAIMSLLSDRVTRNAETFDAAFGFEAMRLDAVEIAPIVSVAGDLDDDRRHDSQAEARLVDALTVRLGADRVCRPHFGDTHAPERAGAWRPVEYPTDSASSSPADGVMRRPLSLLAHAQPIDALAEVPDGPPMRFRWRRVVREVARAEGPERITPHWLRASDARTRDYYRVEDTEGRRYWLYRDGLYGGETAPRWFLHGLFA